MSYICLDFAKCYFPTKPYPPDGDTDIAADPTAAFHFFSTAANVHHHPLAIAFLGMLALVFLKCFDNRDDFGFCFINVPSPPPLPKANEENNLTISA